MTRIQKLAVALCALSLGGALPACLSEDGRIEVGLTAADPGPLGPVVTYRPLAKPIPEVPFPSDLLLRPEPGNLSGAAWNISREAPTKVERDVRTLLGGLDGFGPSAPITVGFEGPIALETVTRDSVLIINIEPGHAREGEQAILDLGRGYFPTNKRIGGWWAFDPMSDQPDLLFPPDNYADLDGDGVEERLTHYEKATNTLILRPILPLAQGARHAVLLLRTLEGEAVAEDGTITRGPVRSPFENKAHSAHSMDVQRALELADLTHKDLAFGWVYTTSDLVTPMVNLRNGLYGKGPLKRLAEQFPPGFSDIRATDITHDADGVNFPADPQDNAFILQAEVLQGIFEIVGTLQPGYELNLTEVDYVVFGSLETPDIRTGMRRTVGLNLHTGEGEVAVENVPFVISVPVETEVYKAPFPIVLYFHGTGTSRMESLAIANAFARQGIATVSFDQVGHGPLLPDIPLTFAKQKIDGAVADVLVQFLADLLVPDTASEFAGLDLEDALVKLLDVGLMAELAVWGRTEDANGDGALESSESFFFANPFKQCASFQQDLVDTFQLIRVLRGLRQAAVPPKVANPADATAAMLRPSLFAGDFNADGVLDIGGPNVPIGVAGTSLGGFHAIVAGALEPEISTATPIVAGAHLADIMTRSTLTFITERIFLETFGPLVVGCPDGEGGLWLSFNNDTDKCRQRDVIPRSFAHLLDTPPGTEIRVVNRANHEERSVTTDDALGFSVAVESDRWDPLLIVATRPDGSTTEIPVQTPYEGTAHERNTPDFRRFFGISQHALGRCDPANFAHLLFADPAPGTRPTSVLYENAVGDDTVPISTGVMAALITGVFGDDPTVWGPRIEAMIDADFMTGTYVDIDDIQGDNGPEELVVGLSAPVPSGNGESAIRFADVDGEHAWIAIVDQSQDFDWGAYAQNQIALFHRLGGLVVDDHCIAKQDCAGLDNPDVFRKK